ncbi:fatty acid cis/trans isomerase [Moritella sp. F3]|uniref:fatty acid cis/trans isomerase n=1 Tax=Moritella sp. F3 TaxID=2718882 RepID=UPI0018E1A265|nr:fatty acid cis/trans isomerase [Moritella sp. F3]GIC78092.1 9-hexadecenoic acid cis-trans isomerase [Moritella sp. F1]GIC83629.1 9-hexadecenoic acid cis-trans isomerase [Moritella sp. F3]
MSRSVFVILFVLLSGCAAAVVANYDVMYGTEEVQVRTVSPISPQASTYLNEVQPLLNQRCVVCHGCYDAPCQLKLTSPAGIERGLSKSLIHSGSRLLAIPPTRLYEDATSTQAWREQGFSAVLNERKQVDEANLMASVLYRSLALKQQDSFNHDSVTSNILPESYDFSLNREQQCSTIGEFDDYALQHPEGGMPYGLPALSNGEFTLLTSWLSAGAKMSALPVLSDEQLTKVAYWEQWLNKSTLKSQLVSRYIYEHLFLSHLYFSESEPAYFKLVRSKTPPGMPIEIIATRRPYEDPKTARVYYRLQRERETILAKTHLPYALNPARMATFKEIFEQPQYEVNSLPSYKPEVASNPFITFEAIPAQSRYKFMLQEAQNTIMGFIKGPVCRGQIAVNVIDDHFWVFFVTREAQAGLNSDNFLSEQKAHLRLPAESESNAGVVVTWYQYSQAQKAYSQAKKRKVNQLFNQESLLDLHLVWSGENLTSANQNPQGNDNAALTIFRHFDSATVVKGLVGQAPKTAWLIDYPLLERIHYLLVAGFDVYGNVGHQLNTRLYMDFLRMEAEFNFLNLLPKDSRQQEHDYWYRDEGISLQKYLEESDHFVAKDSDIDYQTQDHKAPFHKLELFGLLKQHLAQVLPTQYALEQEGTPAKEVALMQVLMALVGKPVNQLPETAILLVNDGDKKRVYSLVKNVAHSNMSSLLDEESNLLPAEDTLTVVSGIIGDYPGVYLTVDAAQLPIFVARLAAMQTATDYSAWLDDYGVRRSDPRFWPHSDTIQALNQQLQPINAGLLDYNRLQNR